MTSSELEPPFGHAELASLAGVVRRTRLDLHAAMEALKAQGILFDSEQDSLEKIARAKGITPMAVYAVIRRFENEPAPVPHTGSSPEEVEARYAGSGLGRKGIRELVERIGLDQATAQTRLTEAGIFARPEDNSRELAERHGVSPIDLLKVMMIPGFRP